MNSTGSTKLPGKNYDRMASGKSNDFQCQNQALSHSSLLLTSEIIILNNGKDFFPRVKSFLPLLNL